MPSKNGKKDRKALAHVLLLTAQLCFSGWHIVGSMAMKKGANPFIFALYRETVAAVLMFILLKSQNMTINIDKSHRLRFFILGMFSFINVVGAALCLTYISATRFAIFQPSIPCIATVVSIFVGYEPFTVLKSVGILLAVGGAVITEVWNSNDDSEKNVLLGTIIVVCQVCAMACLVVFVKPMLHKYKPPVVTFVYYSIGGVLTLIATACFAFKFEVPMLYFEGLLLPWLALAYASTFATLYPYNALSWAGKKLSPGVTTVYATFQPVGTILLTFLFFDKMISFSEGVGAVMVMAGLLVTVYAQSVERNYIKDHAGSDDEGAEQQHEYFSINPSEEQEEDDFFTNFLPPGSNPASTDNHPSVNPNFIQGSPRTSSARGSTGGYSYPVANAILNGYRTNNVEPQFYFDNGQSLAPRGTL